MQSFDKLFSIDSKGKTRYWEVSVNDLKDKTEIILKYGVVDGKEIINIETITKGKGKLSHYLQAISQAKSKYNKKISMGYKPEINKTIENDKAPLPMLALDYNKRGKDIKFPCFVQPKLDGIRGLFYKNKLYSRTGKEIITSSFILKDLKKLNTDFILDGEIYSEELTFQELSGIARKQELDEEDLVNIKKIYFVVYDYISDIGYSSRYSKLKELIPDSLKYVKLIKSEICKNESDIKKFHDKYVSQGYEGLILRNFLGEYEVKNRSKNLQKYKHFIDSEFEIIGYSEGSGKEKGLVIWVCKNENNQEFNVRPLGTYIEREKLMKNAKKYIGKFLTVKFFEYTDGGIPRFPVGVSIRDYE